MFTYKFMKAYKSVLLFLVIIFLSRCTQNIVGIYQSDLYSSNLILTTIKLDSNSMARFWRRGDVMSNRDSGYYKVNDDTLRIIYSPARFTTADRDSFIKYKILPFPLSQSEIEPKNSDNFFLVRKHKLIYLDSLGNKRREYGGKHRIYFLRKIK